MKKCRMGLKILSAFLAAVLVIFTAACEKNVDKTVEKGELAAEEANRTIKIHCYSYDSLNPLFQTNETNMQMLRLVFESLIVCGKTQKAQCVLAESYAVSADGLVWTVNIKKGVNWHDGSSFSAYDVEKTYNDVLGYENASPYFPLLSNLDKILAVSDYEVSFYLKQPQANFINLLDVPIVKYHGEGEFVPTGTGPYIYKEVKEKTVFLTANENWHGGKPNIENIEVKILPDKDTAVYAYVSKETDIVSVTSTRDWGEYSSNSDNVIVDFPSNSFNYICINTVSEPLSNRLLRMAIAQSVDKEKICSEVLLSHGSAADSCMNSEWWVYNPNVTKYSYSRKKAEDTVAELKKNIKIPVLNLMVNSENEDKCRAAEMIKENLHETGIEVNIDYVSWEAFTERVNTGNYQMYLATVKYAADINPQYVISNPDESLARMFAELQKQTTEEGIKEKYFEIQEKIATDINIIPLYFDIGSVMYNKRIKGNYAPFRTYIYNGIENLTLKN